MSSLTSSPATTVLQSHHPDAHGTWIDLCTASVRGWAAKQGYDYQLIFDELFDGLSERYREHAGGRRPILADLGRLQVMQEILDAGAELVLWFDADVLIWNASGLAVPAVEDALFGRECWVQRNPNGRLKTYRSLHNAYCAFRSGGTVLPFLQRATQRIIEQADPAHITPQMVGPKLISALHNIAGFEVSEAIGALSPEVIADLQVGGGEALARMLSQAPEPAGANLCSSLVADQDITELCERLLLRGTLAL